MTNHKEILRLKSLGLSNAEVSSPFHVVSFFLI